MPQETWPEFCERHGNAPVRVRDDVLCFKDGATGVQVPGGHQMNEPPSDDRARLTLQRTYWHTVLGYFAAQFKQTQDAVRGGIPHLNWNERLGPRPQGLDAVGLLEHLQLKAVEPQRQLETIEEELSRLPGNVELAERERRLAKALAKRRSMAMQLHSKIDSMTLTPST